MSQIWNNINEIKPPTVVDLYVSDGKIVELGWMDIMGDWKMNDLNVDMTVTHWMHITFPEPPKTV